MDRTPALLCLALLFFATLQAKRGLCFDSEQEAALKHPTCQGLLYPAISSRSFEDSLRILKSYRGKGVHPGQPLPIFEVEPIRSGQRSLLSIGEGGSSFVGHLLELRRAMLGPSEDHPLIDTLLAVDPAYFKDAPTRYPFLLSRLNRRELSQAQRFFKEFPENYTGGLAQDGGFHLI